MYDVVFPPALIWLLTSSYEWEAHTGATVSQCSATYICHGSWHTKWTLESCLIRHGLGGVTEVHWTELSNPSGCIHANFEQFLKHNKSVLLEKITCITIICNKQTSCSCHSTTNDNLLFYDIVLLSNNASLEQWSTVIGEHFATI